MQASLSRTDIINKFNSIATRIGDFRETIMKGDKVKNLSKNIIEQDIKKLKEIDELYGCISEAIFNACFFNEEDARKLHAEAIKLSKKRKGKKIGDRFFAKHMYAVSLINMNCWSEAIKYILEDRDLAKEEMHALVRYSCMLGRFKDAAKYCKILARSSNTREMWLAPYCRDIIKKATSFLEEEEISEEDVVLICMQVEKVLHEHKVKLRSEIPCIEMQVNDFYGENVLHVIYNLQLSPKKIMELNDSLNDYICSMDDIGCWDKVIPQFDIYKPNRNL